MSVKQLMNQTERRSNKINHFILKISTYLLLSWIPHVGKIILIYVCMSFLFIYNTVNEKKLRNMIYLVATCSLSIRHISIYFINTNTSIIVKLCFIQNNFLDCSFYARCKSNLQPVYNISWLIFIFLKHNIFLEPIRFHVIVVKTRL